MSWIVKFFVISVTSCTGRSTANAMASDGMILLRRLTGNQQLLLLSLCLLLASNVSCAMSQCGLSKRRRDDVTGDGTAGNDHGRRCDRLNGQMRSLERDKVN